MYAATSEETPAGSRFTGVPGLLSLGDPSGVRAFRCARFTIARPPLRGPGFPLCSVYYRYATPAGVRPFRCAWFTIARRPLRGPGFPVCPVYYR
jgi:hypothetical protein